ncbi:MAG: YfhO family protein, partial [Deltaproteobacteria bacterium]|nr:YfhO family protein [Deltaproteobacteria bacterium]
VLAAIAAGAAACAAAWLPALLHRAGEVAAAGAIAPTSTELLGWLAPAGAARFHLGGVWLALAAIAVLGRPRRTGPIAIVALAFAALAFGPAVTAADPAVHLAAASIAIVGIGAGGLIRVWRERPGAALAALGAAAVVIAAALSARHVAVAASIGELIAVAALLVPADGARAAGLAVIAALALCGPGLLAGRDAAPLVSRGALLERPMLAPPPGARVYRPPTMDTDTAGPPGRAVRIERDALLAGDTRGAPGDHDDPIERARDDHATLAGDVAARFGAASAQTADPGRQASEDAVWRDAGIAGGRLFDRYAIAWAILPTSVVMAQQETPTASRGRWALAEQHPARSRAFVAARTRGARSPAAERALTFAPPDERPTPLDTVVIAGAADDAVPPTPLTPCAIASPVPEQVEVTCPDGPAGWAVITDAWAPGWSVTVDGADAEVARADALVRAVRVGPGAHAIVWCYRTPGLRAALLVSGLAWLHLAFGAWLVRRRRRPKVL